jgi:hypothetical protein
LKLNKSLLLAALLVCSLAVLPWQIREVKAAPDSSFKFGFEGASASYVLKINYMVGTNFTFLDPVETQAELTSITFHHSAYWSNNEKIKYALYNSTLNLIASTQEYVGQAASQTLTFADSPTLTNNTVYWLLAWGTNWYYYKTPSSGNSMSFNLTQTYTGNFPDIISPSSYSNIIWGIYGAYSTREELIDSYPTSNYDGGFALADLHPSDSIYSSAAGQTFKVTQGNVKLTKAQFYLGLIGSPIGTDAKAVLYLAIGTYGVNATPTGSALAQSDSFYVNQPGEIRIFIFKFHSQPILINGTVYAIVFQNPTSGTINTTNYVVVNSDQTSPTHVGNSFRYRNGAWNTTYASRDVIFYVYGVPWLLDLRIKDANGKVIEGATVYINATAETSDSDGWVKTTCPINSTVNIQVKFQDVVVNGSWTVSMDEDKTFNVSCTVYSLTIYVTNQNNVEMSGATLTLSRTDGYNYTADGLSPVTASYYNAIDGRYVWSQLANQTSSYTVKATATSGESNSATTALTTDTEKEIVITTTISGGPPATPPPPYTPPVEQPPVYIPPVELPKVPGEEFNYGILVLVGVVGVAFIVGVARVDKRSSQTKIAQQWQRKTRYAENLGKKWKKKTRSKYRRG